MINNIFLTIALLFQLNSIPREQIIMYAEYSINSIPDTGQGIPITVLPGQNTSIQIDNLNLNVGDVIYIRVKISPTGLWSAPKGIRYTEYGWTRESKIVTAEYFIGPDPGEGNGNSIPVTMGTIVPLEIPNLTLSDGDVVRIRVKDTNGRWSTTASIKYSDTTSIRGSKIVLAEYFTDPTTLPGQGIPISITPGEEVTISVTFDIPTNEVVYFRVKDNYNRYSIPTARRFIGRSSIRAGEYYVKR